MREGELPYDGTLILYGICLVIGIGVRAYRLFAVWPYVSRYYLRWSTAAGMLEAGEEQIATAYMLLGVGRVCLLLGCLVLLLLFLLRKRTFRPLALAYPFLSLAHVWGLFFLAVAIDGFAGTVDVILLSAYWLAWLPYLFHSKRLRQVFVR